MEEKKEYKYISKADALTRLQKYCAYQDRCHSEVRSKLLEIGCYGDDLEEVICELIADNFLNEERFARIYAGSKFRVKRWGRSKIRRELRFRHISDYCLKKAMEEISDEDYDEAMRELLRKKGRTLREKDRFKRNGKLAAYLLQKGYESWQVWPVIKSEDF